MPKIDSAKLFKELYTLYIDVMGDWLDEADITINELKRRNLEKAVSSFDPYVFFEKRIDLLLESYDRREESVRDAFEKVITFLKDNKIADVQIQADKQVELANVTKDIEDLVEKVNQKAEELLSFADMIGYKGDNISFLESLRDQTTEQILAMFLKHLRG